MTILELRSENVKKISVVEIKPTPTGLVIVSGKNGAGKSSVIDTIEMTLGGADHIPSKPVRKGQDKATGELNLGDFTVKRVITAAGGSSLIVRNKDGIKMESPQTLLDGFYRSLTFDPLEFARQKPADRSKTLRELLGLDFTKLEAEYRVLYDQRTEINRVAKAKEAMLGANPRYKDVPAEEQSTAEILEKQRQAMERGHAAIRLTSEAKALKDAVSVGETRIERLSKTLVEIEAEIARLTKKRVEVLEERTDVRSEVDAQRQQLHDAEAKAKSAVVPATENFVAELNRIEAINAKVRKNRVVDEIAAEFKARTKESEALTKKMEAIERQKRDAIANAKFPVPGLGLSDSNEVTFDGIPFDNASTAEQLKISVAMGLAMNPKLRVLLIRQGNDLDADNLKLIADMATAANAQIWLEKVDVVNGVSVIIEDGHVKPWRHADLKEEAGGEAVTNSPAETPIEGRLI